MHIRDGFFRFEVGEDGFFRGYMGGAISLPEMLQDLKETDAREEVELAEPIFLLNADMGYNGDECTLFSMAMYFEGTGAYIIRDELLD